MSYLEVTKTKARDSTLDAVEAALATLPPAEREEFLLELIEDLNSKLDVVRLG